MPVHNSVGFGLSAGLLYYPSTEGFNSLTSGLLAVTGGTGLYTGASGYWQTLAPAQSQLGTKVPPDVNGFTLNINYGQTS
ncbi:hypothetical protein WJX82_011709 [Trebouxia sp. C0006]